MRDSSTSALASTLVMAVSGLTMRKYSLSAKGASSWFTATSS